MRKTVFVILMIFQATQTLMAEKSPLNDSYFLGEIPDSAAIGMGQAYVGVSGGPFSSYWNPAGLNTVDKKNSEYPNLG